MLTSADAEAKLLAQHRAEMDELKTAARAQAESQVEKVLAQLREEECSTAYADVC
jgi:F0F1-type ATP synthase membrane subunit b/b'